MEWTTVGSIPSIYFLPDFITPAEEASLVSEVHASKAKWVEVRHACEMLMQDR